MADNAESSNPFCRSGDHHVEDDCSNQGEEDTDFLPFRLGCNDIPVNWTRVPSLLQEQYLLEELKPGQPEYDKIVAEFARREIRVARIERLQNMRLLEQFKSEEEDVKKESGNDSRLKICYLYHGTILEKKHICEKGLDQSIMTRGNKGPGLYFSKDPLNCIPFSRQRDGPDETMILKSRVILDEEQDSPEVLQGYVVHEHRRVMVEYLIFCKLDSEQLTDGEDKMSDSMDMQQDATQTSEKCSIPGKGVPWKLLIASGCAGVVSVAAAPIVLSAVGFTASGVAAGSMAALVQSSIGNVVAGSTFAALQSAGAVGLAGTTKLALGTTVGTVVGLIKSRLGR